MTSTREPLAGRCIVVTRPREQAGVLTAALQELGAEVISFPVIEIAPLDDVSVLEDQAANLPACELAFFVSPNAVRYACEAIVRARWPAGLKVAAVGPATAAALREHGFAEVIVPSERYDSEGVIALDEFRETAVRGRRVIIFRGDGGRELLADTLRERGAQVELVSCYRRRRAAPDAAALVAAFRAGRLDALVFSSSEGVRFFIEIVGRDGTVMLARLPVFVPHPRIGDELGRAGAADIVLTAGGDTGIVAGIAERLGDA